MRRMHLLSLSFLLVLGGCFSQNSNTNIGDHSRIPPRTLPKEEDRPLVDEEGFAVLDTIPKTEETPSFPMLLSSTLPNDSQEVGARLPLTFSFDRVMNTKSVEDAFSLSPSIPGTFLWNDDHQSFTFTPTEDYTAGETYEALITSDALDAEGNNLPETIQKAFTRNDALKILAILPTNGQEVSTETDISIVFNQPIAPLTTVDELDAQGFAISITPDFPHRFRLAGTSILQIQGQMPADTFSDGIELKEGDAVEHRLPRSSEMTVSIPDGFTTPNGLTLEKGESVTIRTPRIHLLTRTLESLDPFSPLRIAFDQPIDLSKFQSAFRIGGGRIENASEVSTRYGTTENSGKRQEDMTLVDARPPENFWGYSETYRVWLDAGISGTEGDLKTEESLITEFSTIPFAHVESSFSDVVKNDSEKLLVAPNLQLTLVFDMPPKSLEEVRSHLSLSDVPSEDLVLEPVFRCVDADRRGWDDDNCEKETDPRRVMLSLANPLQNGKTYDMTFSEGLSFTVLPDADRPSFELPEGWEGRTSALAKPEVISFTVAPKPRILGSHAQKDSYREICLFSETPLDAQKAKDFLEITPPPPGDVSLETVFVWKTQEDVSNRNESDETNCQIPAYAGKYALRISGTFAFETEYQLLLKEGTPDIYGQVLSDAFSFSHATGALKDDDIHIDPLSYDISVLPVETNPVVTFRTMNVPGDLSVTICGLSPKAFFDNQDSFYTVSWEQKNSWEPNEKDCAVLKTISVPVPENPWEEHYPEINLQNVLGDDFQRGPYVVFATNPRYTQTIYERGAGAISEPKKIPRQVIALAQVTDLAFLVKNDRDTATTALFSLSNGEPVASAEISGFFFDWGSNGTRTVTSKDFGTTNDEGMLRFAQPEERKPDVLLATTPSGDTVFLGDDAGIPSHHYPLSDIPERAYIFTDRPLYRPGDRVQGKAILVHDDDAHYEPLSEATFSFTAYDSRGNEIPTEPSLTTNTLGSTAFSFQLGNDVALGSAFLQLCSESCFSTSFQIEEYKKPEFSLDIVPQKENVFLGDIAKTDVSGKYYFGTPLAGGALNVTLSRESYRFDRFTQEDGFTFGEEEIFLPYDVYGFQSKIIPPFWDESEQVLWEEKLLDANGSALLTHHIDLPFREEQPSFRVQKSDHIALNPVRESKRYTYEITAEDSNKNPIYSSASFIANATQELVGIKPEHWLGKAGEESTFNMVVVDTDGTPLSNKTFRAFVVYERQQEDEENTLPWGRSYRITEEMVHDETLTTNDRGRAELHFTPAEDMAGNYQIYAEITDERGEKQRSRIFFFVTGNNFVDLSRLEEQTIDLHADKKEYHVGDTAIISVISPLHSENSTYFLSEERDVLHDFKTISGEKLGDTIEIPITEEMVPNIILSLTGQEFGDTPEIASGEISLIVSPEKKLLPLTLTTDKETYLPGETMHLTLNSEKGGEFAVIVTDKANLALFDSVRENIVSFFYGERTSFVQTLLSSVKIAKFPSEEDIADVNTIQDESFSLGAGGMLREKAMMGAVPPMADAMAFGSSNEEDSSSSENISRSDFQDTASFSAIVHAEKNGKTTIDIPLPDNLTTWNILVIGIDPEFRVAEETKEITVSKPLLLRPQLPRFVRSEDYLSLRANVHNETGSEQDVTVRIEVENGTLEKETETISLPSGAEKDVIFPVDISGERGESLSVRLSATTGSFEDSVLLTIPILAPSHPEAVATSGAVSQEGHTELVHLSKEVLPTAGELTISTSATIANYLDSGLQSIFSSSFSSAGSIADGVLGMVLYQEATSLPSFTGRLGDPKIVDEHGNKISLETLLSQSIAKLEALQRYDGGWAYWEGSQETSPELTARILAVYPVLKRNNIPFDSAIPERAFSYLTSYYTQKQDLTETKGELENTFQADRRAGALLALSTLDPENTELASLQDFLLEPTHEKLLSISGKLALLQTLLIRKEENASIAERMDELLSHIEIDPRGSFLASENGWSPLGNSASLLTSSLLKALVLQKGNEPEISEDPIISRMVRWLLRSRDNGSWGDTYSTAITLDALVSYLRSTHEYNADYEAKVIADGRVIQSYSISSETLFDIHTIKIRTADILTREEGLPIQFWKNEGEGTLYYEMLLRYFLPTAQIAAREEGIGVRREYYRLDDDKEEKPVSTAEQGEVLRGEVTVSVPEDRRLVAVEVPIPAGTEIVNFRLKTADQRLSTEAEPPIMPLSASFGFGEDMTDEAPMTSGFSGKMVPRDFWLPLSPWTHTEIHDDRLVLYAEHLSPGVYSYTYFLRATHEGVFGNPPARAEEMETPEIFGRTAGGVFEVTEAKE